MKVKLGTGACQAVSGRQVFLKEGIDDGRIDVQVGVGTQELSPDQCREFADALKDAANQKERRGPFTIHNDPRTGLWTITAPPGGKEYGPYEGSEDAAIHCAREEGAAI